MNGRPNLLFLYTDEQAVSTLAAYGNDLIEMPNLNRLAEQSTVFAQAYVSQPVCTPSRSTLLTGLYPHTNGCVRNNVPLPATIPCLPELSGLTQYVTAHMGKWHLGDEVFAQHGFSEWVSIEDMYRQYYSAGRDRSTMSSYHHFLIENGFAPAHGSHFTRQETARLPEQYSKPAFLAREASRFIQEHKNTLFLLYVNFLEPHMPFFGPRDSQYDPANVPLPANYGAVPGPDQSVKARLLKEHYYRHGHSGLPLKTDDDWRRIIANYWGLCSLVDTYVGVILDTLEQCGLTDNTIIVFTSDHGDMMGAHHLLTKCLMFEEAVRVPLFIKLPEQKRGTRVPGPVSQIDLVPTLLDLLGVSRPGHLQGQSVRPRMEDPSRTAGPVVIEWNGPVVGLTRPDETVMIEDWMLNYGDPDTIRAAVSDPVRTVITPEGWKFTCSPLGEHELYNLNDDPGETRNLFSSERGRCRALCDIIADWQRRTGDTVSLPQL